MPLTPAINPLRKMRVVRTSSVEHTNAKDKNMQAIATTKLANVKPGAYTS
jgi:hypothetical protein